ncbi:hypothetical protein POI8812_03549 [Pontivivens insulae]|uniref:Uncharacterized protein n=1 Tax=Pontivivens insulae TaxID=1639689 RepID=A0A2R8AGJ6_9RHOB|nr:hypothetical protein DFR53_3527 [Pontivivens insulae]SPF31198.1 hypothetical protein POI8812_03549 [Pontivivens insulae]
MTPYNLYAQMADGSYEDTVVDQWRLSGVPTSTADEWSIVSHTRNSESGFAAAAFQNSRTNELVVSFAGTTPFSGADMAVLCYPKCPRSGLDFPHFDHTDGLDASGNFISAAGTLFPIALCGTKLTNRLRL